MKSAAEANIPAPRNSRALFQLIARLPQAGGDLARLFDQVDCTRLTPSQIEHGVFRRAPRRLRQAWAGQHDAKAHFISALTSPEFRARSIELFLGAFPEKGRLLFIHIPKCAGTDLRTLLPPKFPSLQHTLMSTAWTPDQAFFAALAEAANAVQARDEILIFGHIALDWYVATIGTRPRDRIFTVIRDPFEIALSQANYAISVLVNDPEIKFPHTRETLDKLGIERLPPNPDSGMLKRLALRAFLDPNITRPNPICAFLAGAGKSSAEAVRNLVTHNVEVTDTTRYNRWLKARWGIDSRSRHNSSIKFLSRIDLEPYRHHLDTLASEDRKVFDLVSWGLQQAATPSIRGLDLLDLAARGDGPYAVDFARDEIVRRDRPSGPAAAGGGGGGGRAMPEVEFCRPSPDPKPPARPAGGAPGETEPREAASQAQGHGAAAQPAVMQSREPGAAVRRRAPSRPRETFDLFASYGTETGLEGLFETIDATGVTPRQVCYAVHGRPPGCLEEALPRADLSPRQRFVAALASNEFRAGIVRNLLEAFPERKRLLFVHIPRTGGSQLSARLRRFPSLTSQLTSPNWAAQHEFHMRIRQFVLAAGASDSILVRGHNTVEQYRAWGVIRFGDPLFAVLRDPIERTVSEANYVLTRMFAARQGPDSAAWRQHFGIGPAAAQPSSAEAAALVRKILRTKGVVQPNTICRFLGDGTAARAIENVVIHDIELTDLHRYEDWCRRRWGIDSRSRSNASKAYVTLEAFSGEDRAYIASITEEDAKLYQLAQRAFAKRGGDSLTGAEIL